MKLVVVFLVSLLLLAPLSVSAVGAAGVQGTLTVNGKVVRLSAGIAHLHDNAEGVLDTPQELRIVLTDREVNDNALRGLVFLEVEQAAAEGKVRGLLLTLDPDKRDNVTVTLLYPPPNPREFLLRKTISATGKPVIGKFEIADGRVRGEFEDRDDAGGGGAPKVECRVKFDVPLYNEPPVTEDLKGKDAMSSPLAELLSKKVNAMARGDVKAVQKLSSKRANIQAQKFLSEAGKQAVSFMKQAGVEMKKDLNKITRVVVRGDRAVVIFAGKQWASFVKEDGEWKSDN